MENIIATFAKSNYLSNGALSWKIGLFHKRSERYKAMEKSLLLISHAFRSSCLKGRLIEMGDK